MRNWGKKKVSVGSYWSTIDLFIYYSKKWFLNHFIKGFWWLSGSSNRFKSFFK